jgi:hypothetical protein
VDLLDASRHSVLTAKHLQREASHSPLVDFGGIRVRAHQELRRTVPESADLSADCHPRIPRKVTRHTEIAHFRGHVLKNEDVGRLEVAVHDLHAVQVFHCR